MTVIKLTSSGKGIQIIDDLGNVYQTSKLYVQSLLDGNIKGNFILCNRLVWKASPDRFMKSPLWDPKGEAKLTTGEAGTAGTDAFSPKGKSTIEQTKNISAAEEYKL